MRRRARWAVEATFVAGVLFAPDAALGDDPMLLHDRDGLTVRAHFQVGLNAVIERDLFWNYAATVAPSANFDPNTRWIEGYVMPGISFTRRLGGDLTAYGKLSIVASGTLGTDAFAVRDTGRITLEDGYLGLRSEDAGAGSFDLSLGPRDFKAGTGMLIANGGSSGFERGALKLGPRKAWEVAALGRFGLDGFSGTAFYLEPNELRRSRSDTRIAGADVRHDGADDTYAGVTFGQVLDSSAPYPQAAPGGIGVPKIIPGGRDGLKFVNFYGRAKPFRDSLENFFVAGDLAYEWNGDVDLQAWAGRFQAGYTFANIGWAPTLSYSYQTFSGDNPSTSKLERFDPLYFEGTPSSWSTGSKSSMVFINSNVNAHQLSLRVTPTVRDTLTLRYAHIRANQLRSPIQFGQATRLDMSQGVPEPIAGVTKKHLADDIYVEYSRSLNPHTYLTAGFSVSFPAAGAASIANGHAPAWTGGFVNVVVNF